jgi:2-keto-4-pentenoate hydratase/2-oxohepta-3-ene-1,7-dioic acid hydratase in catechol pathway
LEKYVRYEFSGEPFFGRVEGASIATYDGPPWLFGRPTGRSIASDRVRLLHPVEPSKIILVGLNYHAHVKESQSAAETPKNPILFLKPTTSLIGPGDSIVYPQGVDRVDYEAELAVVIGRQGRHIEQAQADDYIFGYTCLNDVTARNIQKQDGQWTRGKGFDTFCAVGPHIVRGVDISNIAVEAYLNGKQKQSGKTSSMIFSVPFLISFISSVMTLLPGDVISTGTPQGIDPMQRGDTIEIRIEEIGSLINTIV